MEKPFELENKETVNHQFDFDVLENGWIRIANKEKQFRIHVKGKLDNAIVQLKTAYQTIETEKNRNRDLVLKLQNLHKVKSQQTIEFHKLSKDNANLINENQQLKQQLHEVMGKYHKLLKSADILKKKYNQQQQMLNTNSPELHNLLELANKRIASQKQIIIKLKQQQDLTLRKTNSLIQEFYNNKFLGNDS